MALTRFSWWALMCMAAVPAGGGAASAFTLASTAFSQGGAIPSRYTCEGDNVSPPLRWTGVPAQARTLVLIVDDPDAPDPAAPKMTWVHWILYNIPVTATALDEAASRSGLPPGTREGITDFKSTGWGGPCPPIGRHRYFHRLYALDTVLPDLGLAHRPDVDRAMKGHIIAEAGLMGTYEKRKFTGR